MLLRILRKSTASLIELGMDVSRCLSILSMQPEMCCVRVAIPETIGRPDGWIFRDSISISLCGLLLVSSIERIRSLISLGSLCTLGRV